MSIKHVNKYYNQICEQYKEMINDIKDVEREAEQGLVEPERVDRLKTQIEPIKQNYMTLSYIMYLLNEPQKKRKQVRYAKQNNKLLKESVGRQQHNVVAENECCLQGIRGLTAELREDNQ